MSEEFDRERKDRSTLSKKGGVLVSREGNRDLTTVEWRREGAHCAEEFGSAPLSTWIVDVPVDVPPLSSLPRKCAGELSFSVFSKVRESPNPTTGYCNTEMMAAPLSGLG